MDTQTTTTIEVPAHVPLPNYPIKSIASVSEGLILLLSATIPIASYGMYQFLQLDIKRRNAELEIQIQEEKRMQEEGTKRVEYLEGLVKTLVNEIFILNQKHHLVDTRIPTEIADKSEQYSKVAS